MNFTQHFVTILETAFLTVSHKMLSADFIYVWTKDKRCGCI